MIRESQTAVVARNERWSGHVATEPYEAGWAAEAVIFIRALSDAPGAAGTARVEISPDGMGWVPEGTTFPLPVRKDAVTFARVAHFGNWLRVSSVLPDDADLTVLVTLHLKA
jgi:hypothetical protein